jgi:hypothetical protein
VARTPVNLPAIQDKRAEVVKLRGQGLTWDQIAERTGYSSGSGALKAWRKAIQQKPDLAVTEIRAAERERLEQMDARLADLIARPPIKTTSIGRTQWDPRTCTCDVKGATNRDHDPDCQVQPVLDEHLIVAAIRERRANGESYRRLTGADATQDTPFIDARTQILIADINNDRARHGHPPMILPGTTA